MKWVSQELSRQFSPTLLVAIHCSTAKIQLLHSVYRFMLDVAELDKKEEKHNDSSNDNDHQQQRQQGQQQTNDKLTNQLTCKLAN